MEHLLKKYNAKRYYDHLSFLYPHNTCGYIHEKDCSNFNKCCHHSYDIPLIAKYANHGFLDVIFVFFLTQRKTMTYQGSS